MDRDAWLKLRPWIWARVQHARMLRQHVPYPRAFRRAVVSELGGFQESECSGPCQSLPLADRCHCQGRSIATRYARFAAQRWQDGCLTISAVSWSRLRSPEPIRLLAGVRYYGWAWARPHLIDAARKHGIVVRRSWNRRKLWQALLGGAELPRAPRFDTYLVHRWTPAGVVSERRGAAVTAAA